MGENLRLLDSEVQKLALYANGAAIDEDVVRKLVPLAVTSAKRVPQLPNVPTMAEAGVTGYEFGAWHGIAVRAGTPQPIINRLYTDISAIVKVPAVRERFVALGADPVGSTPAEFATTYAGSRSGRSRK